jgi:lipopolysaccharide biosynthesis regulator YciM
MIYDLDNKACSGVELVLDGKQKTTTDINGRFFLSDVKQGEHAIQASEADHETLDVSFRFENRTQVLYLKMVSFDQLLSQAQDALGRKKWEESETLLKRATAIHSTNVVMVYLQAILDYRQENYSQAASRLESLLSGGSTVTYVYLFLADLYQYNLGKPELAQKALSDYLRQSDNPDVRKRLDEMRTASAK